MTGTGQAPRSTARLGGRDAAGAADRLLVECVRAHDWGQVPAGVEPLLPHVHWGTLLRAARRHRVTGCVRVTLRHLSSELPAEVVDELEAEGRSDLAEHMRALGAVHLLSNALDPVVDRWAVVKGPVLASHVYDRPDLRTYQDVDVLVAPGDLGAAISALERAGCRLMDRNWTLLSRELLGEVHLMTPSGVVVDLHWSLLNRDHLRRTFSAPTAPLLERGVVVSLGGTPVRTLDPLDTLVHLTLHAAMSGGDRLLWLKDVEQAWRHVEPGLVPGRAEEWRARLPVAVMLARTSRVLGLDVTDLRSAGLLPRPLAGLLAVVEGRDDFVSGGEPGTATRLLTRALRRDGLSTLAEAGRRAATRLRVGQTDRSDRPDEPTSVLFDSGGDAGRRAYLELVGRSG